MDNVCHTLVGAACGEAGLARRTRFGAAALLGAANLPDLDVLVFATGTSSVAFRRGWTHGVLAQALLPLALTAVLLLVARWRPRARPGPPARAGWLLALAYLGVFSHVGFDWLNTYGIRLLMPLDNRWFYGDAVFIVDPWLWLALGGGVWLARRRGFAGPARVGLVVAGAYVAGMLGVGAAARADVRDAWVATYSTAPQALMVGPMPVTPFTRSVVVDAGDAYYTGTAWWPSGHVRFDPVPVPKGASAAGVAAAREAPAVRGFLVWSRFPYWTVEDVEGRPVATVRDMRFGEARGDLFSATPSPGLRQAPDP
jgi:inner membrane protein